MDIKGDMRACYDDAFGKEKRSPKANECPFHFSSSFLSSTQHEAKYFRCCVKCPPLVTQRVIRTFFCNFQICNLSIIFSILSIGQIRAFLSFGKKEANCQLMRKSRRKENLCSSDMIIITRRRGYDVRGRKKDPHRAYSILSMADQSPYSLSYANIYPRVATLVGVWPVRPDRQTEVG